MTRPEVGGASTLFIAKSVPATRAFFSDRLGFDATFQGPAPPRDVAFSEPLQDTHDGLRGFELEHVDGQVLFLGRPR